MDDKWHKDMNAIIWGPVPQKLLASYKDKDGYTASIVGQQPEEWQPLPRYGQMWITNPMGEKVKTGFWMNWPEPGWNIPPKEWETMSWNDRANMEVKQQATAYEPLKVDFLHHKKYNEKDDKEVDTQKQHYYISKKYHNHQPMTQDEIDYMKRFIRDEFHPALQSLLTK
jgi:hypothetical protein